MRYVIYYFILSKKKIRKRKKPVPRGPCGKLFEKDSTKRKGNVDIDGKEYI